MPFATKESKAEHNRQYRADRKVPLMMQRMQKRGQTRISQRAYDLIKGEASPEWLSTLKIIGGELRETPTTTQTEKQRVSGRVKVSPDRVKELIDANPKYSAGTRKIYKSKVNALMKLLCADQRDFSCIYTKINAKVSIIKREYKDATGYLRFMATMVDEFPEEIGRHVAKQNVAILNRRKAAEVNAQQGKTIETNQQREAATDWKVEYDKMVQHYVETDELKAIKALYIDGVRDHKGVIRMIPRNYFHGLKVVSNQKQVNKVDNFYVKSSGTIIINDYKTQKFYKQIKHRLPKGVRAIMNTLIGNKTVIFEGSAESMNAKVRQAIGVGVDDYRRIMKHRAQSEGLSVEAVAKAMAHAPATGIVSY